VTDLAIRTRGLTKRFGRHVAVADLDLEVPRGALYGLIGPNGAGKSTTLRMLAGLERPTAGEITLDGKRVGGAGDGALHRVVGYMPDFFGVYEDMRSWEYLDFFARCHGIPPERRAVLVEELLDLVDLTVKRDADVQTLSRGMKQRLCLAHALVHDPQILLLDEPASGLDPRARLEMRELLRELGAMGKTVVVSSHILAELAHMCDVVGIMERGRLLASGPVAQIERTLRPVQVVRVHVLSPLDHAALLVEGMAGAELRGRSGAEDGADGGWLEVAIDGDLASRADLLARLVGEGVRVAAFSPREGDLEGLFMEITKGEVA